MDFKLWWKYKSSQCCGDDPFGVGKIMEMALICTSLSNTCNKLMAVLHQIFFFLEPYVSILHVPHFLFVTCSSFVINKLHHADDGNLEMEWTQGMNYVWLSCISWRQRQGSDANAMTSWAANVLSYFSFQTLIVLHPVVWLYSPSMLILVSS